MMISLEITHNISSSKGWGRYSVSVAGKPVVTSSTGNAWVSAPHSGYVEEGDEMVVTLQTMERVGKARKETIYTESHRLTAKAGAVETVGAWNGLELRISGAEVK